MRSIRHMAVAALAALAALTVLPAVSPLPEAAELPSVEKREKPGTLLFVRTTPSGAEIRLDGKTLGKSDAIFPVEPGTYKIVVDLEGHQPHEQQITVRDGRITRIELTLRRQPGAAAPGAAAAPQIVATTPATGATDVDPATSEITVTFDRDMGRGFSWTGGGPDYPPVPAGKKPFWRDRRTCVLPVKLERGRYYRVGINSTSYRNFRSADGAPVAPSEICFTTRGATEEVKNRLRKPEIVSMTPPNGAKDVDPGLREIRVTFNVSMGGGFSWTGGGPEFPKTPQGKGPSWSKDRKTCVLPVELKPGSNYRLGLNSASHKNFRSEAGIPLEPVVYTFRTRDR